MNEEISYRSIGVIRTPFTEREGMPIQPLGARGVKGRVEVFSDFHEGLADLEGFSHIYLVYHFHRSQESRLLVKPFLEERVRGVFATRAPSRPNGIGISVVRLTSVEGGVIHVEDVDILDGTPLLDIKPFVPKFDLPCGRLRSGWLEGLAEDADEKRSDKRFSS